MDVRVLIRELEAYQPELEVSILCNHIEGRNGYEVGEVKAGRDERDRPMVVLIGRGSGEGLW